MCRDDLFDLPEESGLCATFLVAMTCYASQTCAERGVKEEMNGIPEVLRRASLLNANCLQ